MLKDSVPYLSYLASYKLLLMMNTLSFDSTLGKKFHLGGLLCIGYQYNTFIDIMMESSMFDFRYYIHMVGFKLSTLDSDEDLGCTFHET